MSAHKSGQWAAKVNKKTRYFGSWRTDPDGAEALKNFNREYPYLKDGKQPPAVDVSNGCTFKSLVNSFLEFKEERMNAGELSPRSFRDYYKTCGILIDHFGRERLVSDLRPEDFRKLRAKLAARFGKVSLKNEINRCHVVFNYAHDSELIDKSVRFGKCFDRPSAEVLRRERNAAGPKLFEREEVLRILDAVDVQMKAMVLLGVNCGFGNTDVASLPQAALNLETGWVNFPRPKTGIQRRVPLWPETTTALKEALASRPAPADQAASDLCFLTRQGRPWVRVKEREPEQTDDGAKAETRPAVPIDVLSPEFGKLLRRLHINGRRALNFYALRHTFETIGGESRDQVAVDAIMGHVDNSMSANYRHKISDERLKAVVETVRVWLFPVPKEGGEA
jgi:integrase